MKTKVFTSTPLILAFIYIVLAFEVINVDTVGIDLFDYSYPIFFATIVFGLIGLFIVKGKMKILPFLALIVVILAAYLNVIFSAS